MEFWGGCGGRVDIGGSVMIGESTGEGLEGLEAADGDVFQ